MKRYLLSAYLTLLLTFTGFSQTVTNVGTDFWIAFPPNFNSSATIKLFISSSVATSGTVSSAFPGVNQNFSVTPGIVTQVTLPSGIQIAPGIEDKGIHVVSNDPIALYGLNRYSNTTDAYLALPVNALGQDYRIVTYKSTQGNGGSAFCAVATQDGTVITVFNHLTNSTTNYNLNQGQTYYFEASNNGDDVTGSRIQSNFPVSVFGCCKIVNVPSGCSAADHIIEQMFPYYSWGKNFVTVALAGRDASGDVFRIVAAEDATEISINGILVQTINTGDHYETTLSGYNSIVTTKAVILAQFAKGITCSGSITGDPLMMLIPPKEQFLTNYTICTVAGFLANYVNVVAPDYAISIIYEDGTLIPSTAFTQIGTTNFYGAQRAVAEGSHTYTSTVPFGVFAYGWASADSYGYPGGGSLSPVGTVNSVSISPPSASGLLNVTTLCFTAHVEDNFFNPVVGVLVNFNITGISNITGTAYTDALGNAQYGYARTGTTPGTDNIYAECFGYTSTTSTASWSLNCFDPTNAGSIATSQQGCGSFTPFPLTSVTLPTGQTGTLEYKWQQSTTSAVAGYSDIAGSNNPDYAPGLIAQTTWFRRMARADCMTDWTGAVITEAVEMMVTTPVTPTVTLTADRVQLCAGGQVNFTATGLNGGSVPVWQWKVNGGNAGTNSSLFSCIPLNGDIITCEYTSSIPCTTGNPAVSNAIGIIVDPLLPVTVSISASVNPVCAGNPVTFTATPGNPGTLPVYQWKLNGAAAGTNNSVFICNPSSGDLVSCILTSSEICSSGNPASAIPILMTTLAVPDVTFTPCFDMATMVNAQPIQLKGGLPLGGTYSGPGVNSTTGVFNPSAAGAGTHAITYSYTNALLCSESKQLLIINSPLLIFNCGSPLTDMRDNKVYPTVQIGSQCWMQTNLDFGTTISDLIHQTDNCIVEKYDRHVSPVTRHAFYEWDEVMRYDATPGLQGLCPPGWHIPTEPEWNTLLNFYQGNSQAGYPLKDPFLNGFKAQTSGFFYLNSTWSFTDFATMFWSSTMTDQTRAYAHGINTIDHSVSLYAGLKANGFSVRCLKD